MSAELAQQVRDAEDRYQLLSVVLASLPRRLLFRGFGFKHKTGTHAREAALAGLA